MERNFIDEFEYDDIAEMSDHNYYYFKGSKDIIQEMFPGQYDEATSTSLSIEKYPDNEEISVSISPCLDEDEFSTDYDWNDIEIPDEAIAGLMEKALKTNAITDEMIEALKRELFMCGANAIEDFIGHDLDFSDDEDLDEYMNEVIEQIPEEDFMRYYEKYVESNDIELE